MFFAPVYSASKFAVVAFVRSLAVSFFLPKQGHANFNLNILGKTLYRVGAFSISYIGQSLLDCSNASPLIARYLSPEFLFGFSYKHVKMLPVTQGKLVLLFPPPFTTCFSRVAYVWCKTKFRLSKIIHKKFKKKVTSLELKVITKYIDIVKLIVLFRTHTHYTNIRDTKYVLKIISK